MIYSTKLSGFFADIPVEDHKKAADSMIGVPVKDEDENYIGLVVGYDLEEDKLYLDVPEESIKKENEQCEVTITTGPVS